MWNTVRSLFTRASSDFLRAWRSMAYTDVAYKLIAFAILTPATTWLLYWLRSGTSDRVVADVEIAMFFFTTPVGIITLILGGSLIVAITAVETACLMAVGVGMTQGVTLNARSALRFGAAHALNVFRLMVNMVGRAVAPQLAGSLALLLLFIAGLALAAVVLTLAVGIFNFSMFSLLITHLYLRIGTPQLSTSTMAKYASLGPRRFSPRAVAGIAALALLAAVGVGMFAFLANRDQFPALITAHRGSSAIAPENTLAAFRLAAAQHTDFIELDVQESADGQVLVVHDSDLMKVGHNPTKIWDGDAASLRSVDIGSFKDPRYSAERVPTLAEALAACKGRCRVIVELKSYGHDQKLEERVAAIVEDAGMENDCVRFDMVAVKSVNSANIKKSTELVDCEESRDQSPIPQEPSHWRKSPLKPMLSATRKVAMTRRSICLPPCRNGRKVYESSLNDALAVRGSIRAAISRNINRVLMQVV
jgi:glycerophosphoryl diester phosphodiesterase